MVSCPHGFWCGYIQIGALTDEQNHTISGYGYMPRSGAEQLYGTKPKWQLFLETATTSHFHFIGGLVITIFHGR